MTLTRTVIAYSLNISIGMDGPLFDDRLEEAISRGLDRGRDAVGAKALMYWMTNLDSSIRHPTPYYETQVTVQDISTETIVHDRGIIYGPWLEGVGSRNLTTRFKGYASLRRAYQSTILAADRIIGPIMDEELRMA